MRVLCLHGHGTSASIFKSQTEAFRSKLDMSYTFDFVDAPFPTAPALGVDAIFTSDYYTWWPQSTVSAIRDAHRWLDNYMTQHGPYDSVMCFSQGCSLVGSYLLYHAKEKSGLPLPFHSAIFICGGLPFVALEDLGLPISRQAHDMNAHTSELLKQRAAALSSLATNIKEIEPGVGLWDDTTGLVHNQRTLPDPSDCFGMDFIQFPKHLRISVPTVHVYGAKDPRWPASVQLAYFCTGTVRMYDHGGGHDIPRLTEVSDKIADLVREICEETNPT